MVALGEASMHTVESTFHGQLRCGNCMLGALRAAKLWVAQASAIAAPPVAGAIARARLKGAVDPAESWLAPTRAVETSAMTRAASNTLGDRTVFATPIRGAFAMPCPAHSVPAAIAWARCQLTIVTSPAFFALTAQPNALTVRRAVIWACDC